MTHNFKDGNHYYPAKEEVDKRQVDVKKRQVLKWLGGVAASKGEDTTTDGSETARGTGGAKEAARGGEIVERRTRIEEWMDWPVAERYQVVTEAQKHCDEQIMIFDTIFSKMASMVSVRSRLPTTMESYKYNAGPAAGASPNRNPLWAPRGDPPPCKWRFGRDRPNRELGPLPDDEHLAVGLVADVAGEGNKAAHKRQEPQQGRGPTPVSQRLVKAASEDRLLAAQDKDGEHVAAHDAEKAALQSQNEDLSKQVECLQAICAGHDIAVRDLLRTANEKTEQVEARLASLSRLKEQGEARLKEQVKGLTFEKEQLVTSNRTHTVQTKELRERLVVRETELAVVKSESDAQEREELQRWTTLMEEYEERSRHRLKIQRQDSERRCAELKMFFEDSERRCAELKMLFEDGGQRYAKLEEECRILRKQRVAMYGRISDLKKQLQKAEAEDRNREFQNSTTAALTEQELAHVVEKELNDEVSGGSTSEQEAVAITMSGAAPSSSSSDPDAEDPKRLKTELDEALQLLQERAVDMARQLQNELDAQKLSSAVQVQELTNELGFTRARERTLALCREDLYAQLERQTSLVEEMRDEFSVDWRGSVASFWSDDCFGEVFGR